MSKSVLVIDTPRKCIGCQFFGSTYYLHCILASGNIEDIESKPDWCPLKPLPEKKEYIVPINNIESQKDIIAVGWNACLREITETSDENK